MSMMMESEREPLKQVLSTTFALLDAAQTGKSALEQLFSVRPHKDSHTIVRRELGDEVLFYLFDTDDVLERLRRHSLGHLAQWDLTLVLDLYETGQSKTATEQDQAVAGTVVLRGTKAVGFVPAAPSGEVTAPDGSQERQRDGGFSHQSHLDILDDLFVGSAASGNSSRNVGSRDRRLRDLDRLKELDFERINEASSSENSHHTYIFAPKADPDSFAVRSDPPAPAASAAASIDPLRPGATPPQDVPPATPPRFFNACTPDRVALNAQTYVIVQVASKAAEPTDGTAAGNAAIDNFVGELTIDLHAPGLKANGPTTLTLKVPATGDSVSLRFGLVALRPGIHPINVMAWNGSAQVAGVTLQIAVETEPIAADASVATADMDMREPETGEYTLDVAMDADTRRYRFQLRSDQKDVWPPMYSEPLLEMKQQTYEATIANLNAQARNLYGLRKEDQAVWLRGLGNLLFEQLVPDKLKALLIERKERIRVLNILSEADATPWELLFLADPETGEGDFLAASTTVARWRYGSGPSRSLKRANKVLVLPADAPPQAKTELQKLQDLLGGANTIGDLSGLNALLATGGFDLLHFAAHNVNIPQTVGGAYVPFGKQRWDLTFMGAVPQNKFKSRAPLVFMNACTTSGTTALYTDLASWADRFLKCGSGAFIGTLWEVRDTSARQFSEIFYGELLRGQTLGEAMQAARAKLRETNPGDPTPLAYTLYGNPLARMEHA